MAENSKEESSSGHMTRGEFVKAAALTGLAAVALSGASRKSRSRADYGDPAGTETARDLQTLRSVEQSDSEDILITMQRDLARAMLKPVERRHWGMAIDRRKCVGCHACTIGCVAENKLPPGVVYRPVMTEESGRFPDLRTQFTPRPCMQCRNPSCVPVCPVRATWKRADGVTTMDYDKCIGCRHCLTACPYGARTSDFGAAYNADAARGSGTDAARPLYGRAPAWEEQQSLEYGKAWSRELHGSPIGNARKCHFCLHRLEVGQLPL
jgi:molybdopterin-containing oxidoreductase family iron-sulfur binding subunit